MTDRPIWAPYLWYDARALYLEFPAIPGREAATLTFPLTEGGLAKALKQIRSNPISPGHITRPFTKVSAKVISTRPRGKPGRPAADTFDETLQASARSVLRRLKIGA